MSTSNDQNYLSESRVPEILIGTLVPFVIASVTVAARFFTRAFLTCNWGTDDSWIAVSWILGVILTALNCLLTRYGAGRHHAAISEGQFRKALLLAFFTRLVYPLVLGTTKIALCTLFLRIFNRNKRDRYFMHGLMAFVACYTTSVLFTSIFQCHPVSGAWQVANPAKCGNYLIILWVTAICNILGDVLLLIFVVPRILSLRIDRRQRAALLAIVSLGLIVIAAAMVRLARVTQFNYSSDQAWDGSDITTWSALEISVGLFCACAPPLKPFYRMLSGRGPPTTKGSSNDIHPSRAHPYYTSKQPPREESQSPHNRTVHIIREFNIDIESTTDLVGPMPAAQSYAMTVTTVKVK